jgi:hypothetical protein
MDYPTPEQIVSAYEAAFGGMGFDKEVIGFKPHDGMRGAWNKVFATHPMFVRARDRSLAKEVFTMSDFARIGVGFLLECFLRDMDAEDQEEIRRIMARASGPEWVKRVDRLDPTDVAEEYIDTDIEFLTTVSNYAHSTRLRDEATRKIVQLQARKGTP